MTTDRPLRRAVAGMAVTAALGGVAVAAVPRHASYAGDTSQGQPVAIQISKKGKRLDYQIEWTANCDDGEQLAARTATKPGDRIKPDRKGRFHFKSTAKGTLPGYGKVRGRNRIRGRVNRKRAKGAFTQDVHFKRHHKRINCTTGEVTFRIPRTDK